VKGDLGSVDAKTNDEGLRNQRSKVGWEWVYILPFPHYNAGVKIRGSHFYITPKHVQCGQWKKLFLAFGAVKQTRWEAIS
jgi:hypothetical protein